MRLSSTNKVLFLPLLVLLVFSGMALASDVQQQLMSESTVEKVLKKGVLRVGMDTFVPWAMKDKNGELIGFEIDVARRLAEDMGVKVEFVPTKWSGIIPALLTGKFDVIIGGMGILPKRNLKVNFTMPYDYTGMSMVAHKDKAKGFGRLEDFNRPDVIIAAKLGATSVVAVKKYMPKAQIRQFDSESQVYQELINGRVHAAVGSAPTPAFHAIKHADKLFMPLAENFTREPIGFAVRKGDPDTLNFFNNWINYVASEGWLKERKRYWFETKDWEDQLQ
ncbi:MAG: transporter substrate-binding domain-containing protein [Desulfosarcinaceae bacterium]|nr:transporter substrate-binding domain-containing protein [Desulfosarcinaceae bacterium]